MRVASCPVRAFSAYRLLLIDPMFIGLSFIARRLSEVSRWRSAGAGPAQDSRGLPGGTDQAWRRGARKMLSSCCRSRGSNASKVALMFPTAPKPVPCRHPRQTTHPWPRTC